MLPEDVKGYYERITTALTRESDLTQIPLWMEKNTSNPLKPAQPWSFKGHEYQREIVSSTAHEVSAKKCSQVGASEIFARLLLAMMDVMPALTAIYIMPTAGMAGKFTKGRLDPIISSSKRLRDRVNKDVDSNSMKQFGNSFVHIAGSFGQSAAISTPAQALFRDEYDFCNQEVLTLFRSRLGHAEGGGIIRDFSTPTVPGFGIDVRFQEGSQASFGVRCRHCNDFVTPKFLADVEIPGLDQPIFLLEKEDLSRPEVNVDAAFCRCPQCSNQLRWEDFLDTENRVWVHSRPDQAHKSYHIQPWDVPTVNPIARTLRALLDYERKQDWVNMKVGEAYADADNSFVLGAVKENTSGGAISPPVRETDLTSCSPRYSGFLMAADVGKTTSWLVIGVPLERGFEVVYSERIRQDGDNYLVARWQYLGKYFGISQGVIDAGPDFTSSTMIASSFPGRYWKCYYTANDGKRLENITQNEDECTVSAFRTGCFDQLARRVNSGFIKFRDLPDMSAMLEHLGNMKRTDELNKDGEIFSRWVKTGDDHYAHALNYLNIAYEMSTKTSAVNVTGALPFTNKVRMKQEDGSILGMTPPSLRGFW